MTHQRVETLAATGRRAMLNSVYLSGWEYNRLLTDDPLRPMVSSLPASVLWEGSSLFWMFENVYCTKESLEGEARSEARLGWASGRIFGHLADDGLIQAVDWARDLQDGTKTKMREARTKILADLDRSAGGDVTGGDAVADLIRTGGSQALDGIKMDLMQPLLEQLHCFTVPSPMSLQNWFGPHRTEAPTPEGRALAAIEKPPLRRLPWKALSLCERPTSPHPDDEAARAASATEAATIADLILGTSASGYEDYLDGLAPYQQTYHANSSAMWSAYQGDCRVTW